jgi:hypothetical protein
MRLTPFVIVCAATLGACAHVQPTPSWPELERRISAGQPIAITDASGSEVRGRVAAVSADSLTLNVGGSARPFATSAIRQVRRDGDPLWNGLAIGAALGVGGALLSDSSCSGRPDCGAQIPQRLTFVAVMAAVGAGLDALHRDRTPLYRSPARTGIAIVPIVTLRRAELSIVVDFGRRR